MIDGTTSLYIKGMDYINDSINEVIRQQEEYKERTLAEIITKYDFVVGSIECKHKLMEALPEGANIVCSPYIVDPTMIYAIKKFDITDLLTDPYRAESKENVCEDCYYNDGEAHAECVICDKAESEDKNEKT